MNFRNNTVKGGSSPASCSSSSGEWIYCGWIKNDPPLHKMMGTTFKKLKRRSLRSDHGEERMLVDRKDGDGVNCFYRETNS